MGNFIAAIAGLALALVGIFFAVTWNEHAGLAVPQHLTAAAANAVPIPPSVSPPAPAIAPTAGGTGSAVTLTGNLMYSNQQGKIVPYLRYATARGGIATKALAFREASICVTSVEAPCPGDLQAIMDAYGTGSVTVSGIIDDESLIVNRIQGA